MHQLTNDEQNALYTRSATNTGTIVTVAGANVRAHPWVVFGAPMFQDTSPACWNWTLMAGDSTAGTDDPSHGYDSVRGAPRPIAGCWAAGQAASTAIINDANLRPPAGYTWNEHGVHVPNTSDVATYRTWFNQVVQAVSVREATYHGYTVLNSTWVALNTFVPVRTNYYVCMFPEFGLQYDQSYALANHRLYKPPMYDHWWLQVPAGAGHYVSLDTVTNNSLRIFRDSHIWANQAHQVLVMNVNGILDSHQAKLEVMGLLT
ncbi:hypothetical protein [Archangium violaceum]|uniref:Uncharacterized protein n=1 Tax=Archangium violaceum Cb vi76 TaxID=1406225 RepID=A0A084SQA9_9BACT|nr:hypothetical protein [Archangium violaceum]KFA90644.1 hypothetical protein Q664_27025 [Archangium violaceum Cb vi76]